ncbi:hypothetical protein IWX49DRAFT_13677 [Phyllosticta citricarpa]
MEERTGFRVFYLLWSYVIVIFAFGDYNVLNTKSEHSTKGIQPLVSSALTDCCHSFAPTHAFLVRQHQPEQATKPASLSTSPDSGLRLGHPQLRCRFLCTRFSSITPTDHHLSLLRHDVFPLHSSLLVVRSSNAASSAGRRRRNVTLMSHA